MTAEAAGVERHLRRAADGELTAELPATACPRVTVSSWKEAGGHGVSSTRMRKT